MTDVDPYLWLEEIDSDRALAWVRERDRATLEALAATPAFEARRRWIRADLDATDRIPYPELQGDHVYNFWQTEKNPRGLWRRMPLAAYLEGRDEWETLIDVDALGEKEGESWVFKGVSCLPPSYRRCLVQLSRGGKDAVETREFDVEEKRFVDKGFFLPEVKGGGVWVDRDRILVESDFGEGTLTTSGYPRLLRLWDRGNGRIREENVFEAAPDDVSVWAWTVHQAPSPFVLVGRNPDFFHHEIFFTDLDLSPPRRLPLPAAVRLGDYLAGHLLLILREAWTVGEETYPAGSLVAWNLDAWRRGGEKEQGALVQALLIPGERQSIESVAVTRSAAIVTLMEDVVTRLVELRPAATEGPWHRRDVALPEGPGTAGVVSATPDRDDYFVEYSSFLHPTSLLYVDDRGAARLVRSLPARFDAEGMRVEQFFATSRDGTRVPYFVLRGRSVEEPAPTILYGYGGFEVSLTPFYASRIGKLWLEPGGVYVIANIRGGGEYGPAWHRAALKEHRQRAYDDFYAVARDLVRRGITTPDRLGIAGGSNGGLLVGVAMTQHPEAYGAVACWVPLLDMLRYHKLLAGASWIGEYGDPDDPKERTWLAAYSPYQNVRADAAMPPVLFLTSTRDDRVHPGHARKMAAKMLDQGHQVWFYENVEGGHAGGADHEQQALMRALELTFFADELCLQGCGADKETTAAAP